MNESNQHHELARSMEGRAAPFTFQQEYWRRIIQPKNRLDRLDLPFAIRLIGPLSSDVLHRCFQELTNRHESLRARIVMDDGPPRQYFLESCEFHLETIRVAEALDCGTDPARCLIQELADQKCDLKAEPLFRAKLLRRSDGEHLLFWAIHHFISDGWSINLLFRELWLLYGEFIRGRPSPLKKPPASFSNYQVWQHATHVAWIDKHQVYWHEHLAGAEGIRWPRVQSEVPINTTAVAALPLSFPVSLTARLQELSRTARTLLSLVMLTVYVVVVSRWCSQDDFVIETFVFGRDRLEHQELVGFLAHPIYLRIQLSGEETLIDLLDRVHREYHRTLLHKDFGRLVSDAPELTAGTHFRWLPWRPDDLSGMPMQAESAKVNITGEFCDIQGDLNVETEFKLATSLWNSQSGIRGTVHYGAEFFSLHAAERYARDLLSTAEALAENPYARI